MKFSCGIHLCTQAILLFIPSLTFAYNLAHDFDPSGISWVKDRKNFTWHENVIFDDTDIVYFDWDKQIFEITPEAAMKFMLLGDYLEYPFKLVCQEETLYRGFLVSPLSSKTYRSPVIVLEFLSRRLKIQNGYGELSKEDQRFAPRLKAALLARGILANIDPNVPAEKIEVVQTDWVEDTNAVKVMLITFPQSFVVSGSPMIYLKFAGRPKIDGSTPCVFSFTIKSTDSARVLTKKEPFKVEDIYQGFFNISTSLIPNEHNEQIQPGPAVMTSEFIINSQSPRKIIFTPIKINILPQDRSLEAKLVPQSDFIIGSPMLLKLVVENNGKFPLKIDSQEFFPRISVIDPCGSNLQAVTGGVQTDYHPVTVRQGKAWVAFANYNLAADYVITRPGAYTIQMNVLDGLVKPIQVDIKPGTPSPQDEIYVRLRKIIPKEMAMLKFRSSESGHPVVFRIGNYSTKGIDTRLCVDLVLAREETAKLMSGFKLFGQSPWGTIYLNNQNVETIWPGYKSQIVKALDIQEKD